MPSTPPSQSHAIATQPDRRSHKRALLDRPVMLETEAPSRPGRAVNVSAGGIAVQTELDLAIGERVDLYFELPIGYAVEARATVVRVVDGVAALRFEELSHEAQVALRSFTRISGLHRVK